MTDTNTLPEKNTRSQLSNKALQEIIRPHVPTLIAEALKIALTCRNDNVKIGAIKLLLSKVIPDLKSESLTDEEGNTYKLLLDIPGVKVVKDAGDQLQPTGELPAKTT